MDDPKCRECIYFRQHYVFDGERYTWAGCGHCVYPRLKHRAPDTFACVYYKTKPASEDK